MNGQVKFPEMRHEVAAALRSLSDQLHQELRWGRVEEGFNYYDDLTLNVNVLYDDCCVLPFPETAVSDVLFPSEVLPFKVLDSALDPMLRDLGNRPDSEYLADPRWAAVVVAAKQALQAMEASDA